MYELRTNVRNKTMESSHGVDGEKNLKLKIEK
jgi:hypothetical protein